MVDGIKAALDQQDREARVSLQELSDGALLAMIQSASVGSEYVLVDGRVRLEFALRCGCGEYAVGGEK